MAKQIFSNNARATLATSITAASTSISLATGKGALFASPSGGNWQLATLTDGTNYEIVKITARSTDTLTVTRGQEGTSARTWAANALIYAGITTGSLDRLPQNISQQTDGFALTGASDAAYTTWAANTTYTWGSCVKGTNNKIFFCSNSPSGVSGSSEPTWSASQYGAQTTDNTITWVYVGDQTTFIEGTALGTTARAVIDGATALGFSAVAAGEQSTALGYFSTAFNWSTAVGGNAAAYDMDSIAIGYGSTCYYSGYANGYGNIALGDYSRTKGYQNCTAIGESATNRVGGTHVVTGMSMVCRASGLYAPNAHLYSTAQETYIMSAEINLKTTADDVVSFTIPTGATLFPDEMGLIITTADTATVAPDVSFGVTGNTTALLTSTTATGCTTAKKRKTFAPSALDGINSFTASVKTGATATALKGRFYVKGMLVENEL